LHPLPLASADLVQIEVPAPGIAAAGGLDEEPLRRYINRYDFEWLGAEVFFAMHGGRGPADLAGLDDSLGGFAVFGDGTDVGVGEKKRPIY
jgi:hypothetical protein